MVALTVGALLVGQCLVASRVGAQAGPCPEPNDTPEAACLIASGAVVESLIERPGDIDMYRFVVSTGQPGLAGSR